MSAPEVASPAEGLCASCRHRRVIETRKGSRFTLCRLSESDPRWARYPRLPVLRCEGYERADRDGGTPTGGAPGEDR